ncbi:tRNA preQ1(34) S-adenosylmethionine ribosyltransferase-isomerase QueA [Paenalcaligenes niemegkensis]|uniref:tRNA preQ1(34) S-adenosylmethionine ribosyltransferase-isomerase QueA n=1 Tax=Paenalcaligenes niemegkensis TaxID=2895469 RepID=UPI001EE8605C|nr:tRNA preQ1(34) S-adenosylmethionine ribosyltransferase-isomerase QueA [Paenalcaligenes niemegkensis]MCQ9617163.1 tRNA preQ1(34) S-adenosylmethionine ribosyltransferase-isomerase QueA [Paenalcaligenes niemegkensis]
MPVDPRLDISQFDYVLPPELIAQVPAVTRNASRLLHVNALGQRSDLQFNLLPSLLNAGDLLVFNNTKVIKARLLGHKSTGGKVEVLIERVTGPHTAWAHIRASKSPKAGMLLLLAEGLVQATVTGRHDALFELSFAEPVFETLEKHGATPLPPYINLQPSAADDARYQTVYAKEPGAVAAPTAGLHFDESSLATLADMGVHTAFVTLHVGAGTFQPVRVQKISEHEMHAERYHVPAETLRKMAATRAAGKRIIAVGTTSVRALESAAHPELSNGHTNADGSVEGDTTLFITPGYTFSWIDALVTNFHLPQSTLLMLVSALSSVENIQHAYAHAINQKYRFFSYGDAMFIEAAREL